MFENIPEDIYDTLFCQCHPITLTPILTLAPIVSELLVYMGTGRV